MPAITIKNIPDDLYTSIRESAASNHRSINSEVIFRLKLSLTMRELDPIDLIDRLRTIRTGMNLPPLSDEFLRKAKDEGRP